MRRCSPPLLLTALGIVLAAPAKSTGPPDQATVKAIYARLCAAAGFQQGAPQLEFDDTSAKASAAYTDFNHEPTRIVVERKALETCATFGSHTNDAVAFLLGHELAHFSMGHGWGSDFQRVGDHSQVKSDVALAMANNKAYHLFETQADQKGAFYAYIAGYVPEVVADTLLQRLYTAYGWSVKMSGYPDRPVREELLRTGLLRYQDMAMALRLADHRLILGQYAEAAKLYELLMSEGFRNPMLFTNAGVCYLLQAIAEQPKEDVSFIYPVELDLRERWRGAGEDASVSELLKKGEDLFLQTLVMDRSSDAALADLACVYFLRKDLDGAAHWIAQHGQAPSMNKRTHLVLAAILNAKRGDGAKAKTLLQDPALKGSWIAQRNLDALNGSATGGAPSIAWGNTSEEKIQEKTLLELATGFGKAEKLIYRTDTVLYHGQEKTFWKMSADRTDAAKKTHWLYLAGTCPGYTGKSANGVVIGDPLEKLNKTYGTPKLTVQTLEGELHLYDQQSILFLLDCSMKVSGWTLFAEKSQ